MRYLCVSPARQGRFAMQAAAAHWAILVCARAAVLCGSHAVMLPGSECGRVGRQQMADGRYPGPSCPPRCSFIWLAMVFLK